MLYILLKSGFVGEYKRARYAFEYNQAQNKYLPSIVLRTVVFARHQHNSGQTSNAEPEGVYLLTAFTLVLPRIVCAG